MHKNIQPFKKYIFPLPETAGLTYIPLGGEKKANWKNNCVTFQFKLLSDNVTFEVWPTCLHLYLHPQSLSEAVWRQNN